MKSTPRRPGPLQRTARIALALLLLLLSHPLWAATIIVDETTCTLVDAVTAANTDAAVGGCPAGSGADTIELTTDVTLTDVDNDYWTGYSGLPVVESEITLEGNGFTIERDPAAPPFRFWFVDYLNPPTKWGDLTLNDVTLRNGSSNAGGAVYSRGRLIMNGCSVEGNEATGGGGGGILLGPVLYSLLPTETRLTNTALSGNSAAGSGGAIYTGWYASEPILENCVVSDNVAGDDGGGIYGSAVLIDSLVTGNVAGHGGGGLRGFHFRLTNSTVSNNQAGYGGGGIQCFWLEAKDSTISNNSASVGGGIEQYWEFDYGYTSDLTNVTISGNTAQNRGGGYFTESSMVVARFWNSTISGNTAPSGGGFSIDLGFPSIELLNTIVANSGSGGNCVGDSDAFIDLGSNFDDDGTCGPGFGTITRLDPNLADNGGPTQTHALLPESSAVDAAGDCGLETDQRGFPRNDGACDSGSYEFQCSIAVTTDGVDTFIWFTPDSSAFNVVTGYLSDLLADKDFSQATCVGTYPASPAVDVWPEPSVGDGRYYLARGLTSCVGAQYGDSSLTPDPRNSLPFIACP
jgi:predicted outer membrane repeat protein